MAVFLASVDVFYELPRSITSLPSNRINSDIITVSPLEYFIEMLQNL